MFPKTYSIQSYHSNMFEYFCNTSTEFMLSKDSSEARKVGREISLSNSPVKHRLVLKKVIFV